MKTLLFLCVLLASCASQPESYTRWEGHSTQQQGDSDNRECTIVGQLEYNRYPINYNWQQKAAVNRQTGAYMKCMNVRGYLLVTHQYLYGSPM